MKITQEEIMHIATLSRIRFTDEELKAMDGHLSKILESFETLDLADTSDVPPTAHILPFVNVLRDDKAAAPMDRDKLLAAAPETDGAAYIVPRVVE